MALHNAVRIGKVVKNPGNDTSDKPRPRPILIKLLNHWDKRLLLSNCRKLKNFSSEYKLFLRDDLPPDKRMKRLHKLPPVNSDPEQGVSANATLQSNPNSSPTSSRVNESSSVDDNKHVDADGDPQ